MRIAAQNDQPQIADARGSKSNSLDDIFYLRPRRITVTDGTTGAPIDPYNLGTYSIVSGTRQADRTFDLQRTAYGNLRRDFFTAIPFTLKTGFDLRQSLRDFRGGTITFNYVGRDGRASTTTRISRASSSRCLAIK